MLQVSIAEVRVFIIIFAIRDGILIQISFKLAYWIGNYRTGPFSPAITPT